MNTCALFIIYLLFHLTHAHGGHSQVKYLHISPKDDLIMFGRKVQYKVTIWILRFYSISRESRLKPFGFPLAHQSEGQTALKETSETCVPGILIGLRSLGLIPPSEGLCTSGQCLRNTLWWWQNYMTLQNCLLYGKITCHISNSEDSKH